MHALPASVFAAFCVAACCYNGCMSAPHETIRDLLDRDPFQPFLILTTGGESFTVRNPHSVAFTRPQIFIAAPGSDRLTYVPDLHVSAIDVLANGHRRNGHSGRRRKRK